MQVKLVAVSKYKPVEAIKAVYDAGHRDFGENYVSMTCGISAPAPPSLRSLARRPKS